MTWWVQRRIGCAAVLSGDRIDRTRKAVRGGRSEAEKGCASLSREYAVGRSSPRRTRKARGEVIR